MLVCYARTLYTVTYNPGVVPLEPKLGLESFYTRDFYTCRSDGLPIWCSDCQNWKPDRAHHSGDIQRCVKKMDHYCPWAGGMIGETGKRSYIIEMGELELLFSYGLFVGATYQQGCGTARCSDTRTSSYVLPPVMRNTFHPKILLRDY